MIPFLLLALVAATAAAFAAWRVAARERNAAAELRTALDAARAERARAERLAMLGRVAAGLAHEVGNPLCAITNYAHSLADRVGAEQLPTLRALQREADRIERMMTAFSEQVRPRGDLESRADVIAAATEALGFLSEQGVLRRITVTQNFDAAALMVQATPLQMEQVFANLLLNAADAMLAGGTLTIAAHRRTRASFRSAPAARAGDVAAAAPARAANPRFEAWLGDGTGDDVASIVVADSGIGVAAGDEERIFEPFISSKPEGDGGIGLAIVHRIVELAGGIVWVRPSREGGAAFHIVLPLHERSTR
jgi:signal transduction histidine kinase